MSTEHSYKKTKYISVTIAKLYRVVNLILPQFLDKINKNKLYKQVSMGNLTFTHFMLYVNTK